MKVLLVSGDNRTHAYDEPTAMRDYLVEHGVPTEAIVLDFAGRDTYDSCQRAHRIFGVDEVTVISQKYHVGRAVALCRAAGMTTTGVGDTLMRGDTRATGGSVGPARSSPTSRPSAMSSLAAIRSSASRRPECATLWPPPPDRPRAGITHAGW
ncbi:SanA/YdcF family protein [Knoellia subterranea]|uniref:SanA/YdcF family protein n=1 Tax=Knoellia subterranea TaxID=184882 RepID=UPI000AECB6D6|nr:ElyC/SanA/YdcF family protein [Knoellia subterranea]